MRAIVIAMLFVGAVLVAPVAVAADTDAPDAAGACIQGSGAKAKVNPNHCLKPLRKILDTGLGLIDVSS